MKEWGIKMRTLTTKQLANIVAKIDSIYDNSAGKSWSDLEWHEIAEIAFTCIGYINEPSEYDAQLVDDYCLSRANKIESDDGVDAGMDAYSRRFDCEV